ncbi:hypothetical protein K474DRAFT_1659901 [Panus rudis PR-1116 ss-1]|nr:hypothetical protein K474DRAFT_1659901 [Panus rudis PR-1116 ss-1]
MYSTLVSVALFATIAVTSVNADLTIATPELVQCQPVRVTWSESAAPYDLVLAPVEDPCNKILADLGGDHNHTSLTWTVNVPAGTQAMFSLIDANGEEAWTGAMTVKESNDASCLPANASSSAAGSTSVEPTLSVATTLYATGALPTAVTAAPAASSSLAPAQAVGAANAGLNPGSNAASSIQVSAFAMVLSALAATVYTFVF